MKGKSTPVNAEGYTRVSTLAGALDDKSPLIDWASANAMVGMVKDPSIASQIGSLTSKYGDPWYAPEGKKALKPLIKRAQEAGGSDRASGLGTSVHEFTEVIDEGRWPEYAPAELVPWLHAYRERMAEFECLGMEVFVVNDELKTAGSFDRVWRMPDGRVVVGDLKGLALDTKIPTPDGWTTMSDVEVGDMVFGSDGKPCAVTAKSGVKRIGTYVVTFDDGSEVVCDKEHLWWTFNAKDVEGVRGVEEIRETLKYRAQCQHRVPVAEPLDLPELDLPLPPYLLGAWLGDGHARGGCLTKDVELFDVLESDGVELGVRQWQTEGKEHCVTRTVLGMTKVLREMGLLFNKHVPREYLRASILQRTRILQGLLDTDGTWNTARNSVCFTSVDKRIAEGVHELALSLGQRSRLYSYEQTGFGRTVLAWRVEFKPYNLVPFRHARKLAKFEAAELNTVIARRRLIRSVEPGPDVETACIAVDSPNNTYLCTEKFIPTHNTGRSDPGYPLKVSLQVGVYANSVRYDQVTGERSPIHPDLDLTTGLLVHAPILGGGKPEVKVYELDLVKGMELARLAVQVREARSWERSKDAKLVAL